VKRVGLQNLQPDDIAPQAIKAVSPFRCSSLAVNFLLSGELNFG
jgi:hypothetical protein